MVIIKSLPRSEVMGDNYMMDKIIKPNQIIPRDNKAKGDSASMNAMQAASVEGLPIRQKTKGVRELDLRKTGGFIPPVGIKEKADDIPAMLSNNEFVFTADAVRAGWRKCKCRCTKNVRYYEKIRSRRNSIMAETVTTTPAEFIEAAAKII